MSVPDLETWQKRWSTPERQRLGLRADRIQDGYAQFTVDLRYGDDREGDPLFAAVAITHAVDVAAVSAVLGHLDEKVQQQNGTASLNIHFLQPLAGLFTVAQFSFWGNYIPLVFPVHLRGTGESFAANIGGRVLGTAAAWITLTLSASDKPDPARMAVVGACVAGAYVLIGALLTQLLPEPKAEGAE